MIVGSMTGRDFFLGYLLRKNKRKGSIWRE